LSKDSSPKKYKLTVFLIKDGYANIEDFLSFDGFERIDFDAKNKIDGTLVYRGGFQSKPSWISIFQDLPGFDAKNIWNQSSKALFAINHKGRWFCFTFGYARHLIDEHAYERNFGLIVTLNLSDPDAIKSIDKTNISHVSLHSKEQATREIELSGFEFNDDTDLLKSITGKSSETEDGERDTLSGRDSVSIYTRATVDDFNEIVERLYDAYVDTKYKEIYPWIDKITEERDKVVLEKLDAALVACILGNELKTVWLAIPEVVIWEEIRGFSFKKKKEGPKIAGPVLYQDLDIHEWVAVSNIDDELSAKQLKNKKIYIYWEDGRPPTHWSVYRCLNAEINLNGQKYILNDSSWYNIETSFVTETDKFYNSVPDATFTLPPYGTKTEPEYLKSVSKGLPDFALMDRKVIMIGGGRSRVEFCDLFSKNRDIVHVKKYGGSSLLSHLFFQAVVSGECFLHEEDFRKKANKLLPKSHKLKDTSIKPVASEYNVCVAIMSKVPGKLELPFFSKVSFKHTVKTLQNFGYNVFKLKIDM